MWLHKSIALSAVNLLCRKDSPDVTAEKMQELLLAGFWRLIGKQLDPEEPPFPTSPPLLLCYHFISLPYISTLLIQNPENKCQRKYLKSMILLGEFLCIEHCVLRDSISPCWVNSNCCVLLEVRRSFGATFCPLKITETMSRQISSSSATVPREKNILFRQFF